MAVGPSPASLVTYPAELECAMNVWWARLSREARGEDLGSPSVKSALRMQITRDISERKDESVTEEYTVLSSDEASQCHPTSVWVT